MSRKGHSRHISVLIHLAFLLKQTLVNNSRMKVDKLRLVNYVLQVKLSKTLIKHNVHELYFPIKHSSLVFFILILIKRSLFFLYANIFPSQFEPLFGLPRDTLFVEYFWSRSKNSQPVFYFFKNTAARFFNIT